MGTILCYIYPDMADFEVVLLLHRLRNAGGRTIITIAETMEEVTAQSGLRYLPDLTIDQVNADEAEGLIIPGGPINNEQNAILPLIRHLDAQGKLLAAICFGPQFLGRAGVLDSRQFTTSCTPEHIAGEGLADPFPRSNCLNRRCVQDGHVITAQGHAFVDFAARVCNHFHIFRDARHEYQQLGNIKDSD